METMKMAVERIQMEIPKDGNQIKLRTEGTSNKKLVK